MTPYINNLSLFKKVAKKLGFYNLKDFTSSQKNAFCKSIYIFDNYPIRIRIRVFKNTGLIEVKAFRFCENSFKELPRYLNWHNTKSYLSSIEKYLTWR